MKIPGNKLVALSPSIKKFYYYTLTSNIFKTLTPNKYCSDWEGGPCKGYVSNSKQSNSALQ